MFHALTNTYLEASPDFCASAHKLPETALDIFNQCKGFNFFIWLFLDVVRDNKLFPLAPGGRVEGGGGDGGPSKLPLWLAGGGGTEGTEGLLVVGLAGGEGAEGTEELLVVGLVGGGGAEGTEELLVVGLAGGGGAEGT